MKTTCLFLVFATFAQAQLSVENTFKQSGASAFASEVLSFPASLSDNGSSAPDVAWGQGLAVWENIIAVGAPRVDDTDSQGPGDVFLYQRGPSGWIQTQHLTPTDVTTRMKFGTSIDFSENGEWLVVGTDDRRQRSGLVRVPGGCYIYRRDEDSGRYRFFQKIASRPVQNRFGRSVRVSGDWLAVLDPEELEVVMHQWDPSVPCWVERQTLQPDGNGSLRSERSFDLEGPIAALMAYVGSGTRTRTYHLDASTQRWVSESIFLTEGQSEEIDLFGNRLVAPANFDGMYVFSRTGTSGVPNLDANAWQQLGSNEVAGDPTQLAFVSESFLAQIQSPFTSGVPDTLRFGSYDANSATWSTPTDILNLNVESGQSPVLVASPNRIVVTATGPSGPQVTVVSPAQEALTSSIRRKLFYKDGTSPEERNASAFAYQTRLYAPNPEQSSMNLSDDFITRHSQIEAYYAQVNRDNADSAEALLRDLYPNADRGRLDEIETLFLDLAYGRMAAELIRSKEEMLTLNQARINGTDGTLYFLNEEIRIIRSALEKSTAALNAYLPLLSDSLGVPPVNGEPAGRAIFARYVPQRALNPALDEAGNSVNGSDDVIIASHKDLILIYDTLLHHTRSTSELLWLLIARGEEGDEAEARRLIGDTKRFVFEQRVVLESLFPELADETLRETIGFTELSDGIDSALSDLTGFEQNLNGTINLLGYEPDFLMLIQSTGSAFDSFESFRDILESEQTSSSTGQKISRLGRAVQAKNDAANALDNYGRTQDALESEWTRLADSSIIPRLFDIVGVNPGENGYDTPEDNVGSEIWQQFQSIEVARLRIQRNRAEISNLKQKVAIEQRRRARESQINSEIRDLVIEYGNKQAKLTEQIGAIEAAQAAADNIANIFSPEKIVTGAVIAGVVNAAAQAGGEVGKAVLEGDKEQLAAEQDAAVRAKEDEILAANSAALIQTLLLEMNTLAIDSQEAAVLLRQEGGRLTALYCEKAELERRLDEVTNQLSSRYFADPTHRLRTLSRTLEADIRFEDARRWLFFAARALEYRWNIPLNREDNLAPDGSWDIDDLFKMRNAEELTRFFEALIAWDTVLSQNRQERARVDWFSLREDYFGYELEDDATGDPVLYDAVNPDTGQVENVNAITAFRWELQGLIQECNDGDNSLELCIPFDTVRQNDFQTNVGEFDGRLFSPLDYLDRLETIRVFVKGPHEKLESADTQNTVPVSLTYAGTSFLRTPAVGTPSPEGDRTIGELTAFPTRFYRSNNGGDRFEFEEGLTARSILALKTSRERNERSDFAVMPVEEQPGLLPQAIRLFRERSVATTRWTLNVRIAEGASSNNDLDPNEIDDVLLRIDHRAVQR